MTFDEARFDWSEEFEESCDNESKPDADSFSDGEDLKVRQARAICPEAPDLQSAPHRPTSKTRSLETSSSAATTSIATQIPALQIPA